MAIIVLIFLAVLEYQERCYRELLENASDDGIADKGTGIFFNVKMFLRHKRNTLMNYYRSSYYET